MHHAPDHGQQDAAAHNGLDPYRSPDREAGHRRHRPQHAVPDLALQLSRGFTLVELMLAMVVMALLGIGLTRILINDSRVVSRQDAMMSARQGARAAMN